MKPLKIISLTAENIKKIVVVEITPDGNVVEITGRNSQGKTSVLDAIWWALSGAKSIQSVPIRKGADKAFIRLDLGEIIVTRKFRRAESGETTSTIEVENAEGAVFKSPQSMLDGLLGALSFDPLAFSRMDKAAQFTALQKFAPGIDFVGIALANKADYEARTEANREAKRARAAADAIVVPADLPENVIDEAALTDKLTDAATHNASIETRKAGRADAAARSISAAKSADEIDAALVIRIDAIKKASRDSVDDIERQIEALRKRLTETHEKTAVDLNDAVSRSNTIAADMRKESMDLKMKLDTAPALPDLIEVATVRAELDAAKITNALIAKRTEKDRLMGLATSNEYASVSLTDKMNEREKAKNDAIAATKMPVAGLGFGDGCITLAGVPFEQASDADRLRTSIAIAMASNPKLRVIRVRDGSLLDEDAMKILGEMATASDFQVWIERVDSSGKIGFVMEDGVLKSTPAERDGM